MIWLTLVTSSFAWAISCQKSIIEDKKSPTVQGPVIDPVRVVPKDSMILIDASRDGGVWWFPQDPTTGFHSTDPHQGKALADRLRELGFQVKELGRGEIITDNTLESYTNVIRGPAFSDYTPSEVESYDRYLQKGGSLLLMQDHLRYTANDRLSEHLGVHFTGVALGTITTYAPHAITEHAGPLPYIAGSVVILDEKTTNLTGLGWLGPEDFLDANGNGVYDPGEVKAPCVMGIVTDHPGSRILFIGDSNGLENVPQPLTDNIIKWLF